MSEIAIHIDNVSKRFTLNSVGEYARMTEAVAQSFRNWANKIGSLFRPDRNESVHENEFWALRDINLEIRTGEFFGVVGGNGAGKSTLLKILSRIVSPTTGRVGVRGRVGCLLEVGTGFHPELTGRENVFLNGTILGMSRREIRKRFDEIVAFAEVEQFIDTPVKRYSNGMLIRLGFSVAAHLEPDVLIVDEVLGVGDIAFQAKSLQKAREFREQGRTVLLVSHNLPTVIEFCTRAVLLEKGRIVEDGDPNTIVAHHRESYES